MSGPSTPDIFSLLSQHSPTVCSICKLHVPSLVPCCWAVVEFLASGIDMKVIQTASHVETFLPASR
jgi:hypothetical protein